MELKDKTTETLEKELKSLQTITGMLAGVLALLFVVCIYGLFSEGPKSTTTALLAVPIALGAILPMNYKKIKEIKVELEER
ncbi:redox-active disulfide protein 2 [Flammeovirga sp. EKP202]|uniref:redox-active disulfide protein 2 n=1 Tax=Flammeovirga sp. EKP202 TaxID=2770592 RepID=UPI00165ECEFF|nr:redox-active disulfide protein 2 [Flammeovirga sp. EKP202]MBD0401369.1 redox-active disulfide protein 2 [Flammeovirga sp. EKP202]